MQSRAISQKIWRFFIYILIIFFAVASILPFIWALSSSLKSETETVLRPYAWIPQDFAWENYVYIFNRAPLGLNFLNSIIYVLGQVLIAIIIVPMAGYALARKNFPGRHAIMMLIIILMIVPRQATLVHLFILIKNFPLAGGNNILGQGGSGLVDTYTGLILPRAAEPFAIFTMRQFFWNLPDDLESAAKIDGASEWRTYWNIFLPIAQAGISVVVIFTFGLAWNDFLWPLIVLFSKNKFPIQLGLLEFQSDTGALWAQLMAATVVATIPMIIIFYRLSKTVLQGNHTRRGVQMRGNGKERLFIHSLLHAHCQSIKVDHPALCILSERLREKTGIAIQWEEYASGSTLLIIKAQQREAVSDYVLSKFPDLAFEQPEGYYLSVTKEGVLLLAPDDRGILYGVGKLLRLGQYEHNEVSLQVGTISSHPHKKIRGHQLGYRPKTNAYDAWTKEQFETYIQDLALFGANSIEILPPRTDDDARGPLMKYDSLEMMIFLSQTIAKYFLDVWIWYPNMAEDYQNSEIRKAELEERRVVFSYLSSIDHLFIPGGDPGDRRRR